MTYNVFGGTSINQSVMRSRSSSRGGHNTVTVTVTVMRLCMHQAALWTVLYRRCVSDHLRSSNDKRRHNDVADDIARRRSTEHTCRHVIADDVISGPRSSPSSVSRQCRLGVHFYQQSIAICIHARRESGNLLQHHAVSQ